MPKKRKNNITTELLPWQYEALTTDITHFAMCCGISVGKTYTGAHFVINNIVKYPDLTGLIGANNYDQLSQATLRELFYWLDYYGFTFVIDRMPFWEKEKKFKEYRNILSIKVGNKTATIFTRIMSDPNPLRGVEFSWYWIDESRDTPNDTHDVIMSRLRESNYVKGLITTTTAGEDWVWKRFVKKADGKMFGSIHIPTIKSVEYGLIKQEFYDALKAAYSPQMAAQELEAQHVVICEGKCYYTNSIDNRMRNFEPDENYPLILGLDFNYSPAPMVWEIGQRFDGDKIIWFDELSQVEISTVEMGRRLARKYGNYFLKIYGDASGNRGTTSNAGVTDYKQLAEVLDDCEVEFTINVNNANDRQKDRVENMNRLFCDAAGVRRMFYDPDRCPLLTKDLEKVFWKNGKIHGPETDTTHASDGAGYAMMKEFPPLAGSGRLVGNVERIYGY